MARTWLKIRVDLLGGRRSDCDPPPGRVFIVGPGHTFEQFAEAIDTAFARWDLSHLHEFELADCRKIGHPDDDYAPDLVWLDHGKLRVTREVNPGDRFTYTFDFGDNWEHRCAVEPQKPDPVEEYGIVPPRPVPIWGWGWIPDQYGRVHIWRRWRGLKSPVSCHPWPTDGDDSAESRNQLTRAGGRRACPPGDAKAQMGRSGHSATSLAGCRATSLSAC